mmetsp:Transcript_35121/g.76891  ORF Transcript_35121/g.76891 Transcript_35121/m.76891 type:complete len:108 (-) Transcript_35121:130-453(-)
MVHNCGKRAKQHKHKDYRKNTKKYATKNRTRDIDQIHEDLKKPESFTKLPINEDLPGDGQFYCISCARYFESDKVMDQHKKTKSHKKRLKLALEDPHTQALAEEYAK